MAEIDSRKIDRSLTYISDELIEEAFEPMEREAKRRAFRLRPLLVAAASLALAFSLAIGANAATGGELFGGLKAYFLGIESRAELVEEVRINGCTVKVSNSTDENGRPILVFEDQGSGATLRRLPDGTLAIVREDPDDLDVLEILYEVVEDSDGRALGLKEYRK